MIKTTDKETIWTSRMWPVILPLTVRFQAQLGSLLLCPCDLAIYLFFYSLNRYDLRTNHVSGPGEVVTRKT